MTIKRSIAGSLALLLIGGAALAQTSTSWRVEEYSFNSGGVPSSGTVLTSAGFSITLASVGDAMTSAAVSGVSFKVEPGFSSAYLPPGEITGLLLTDRQTLTWTIDPSAGQYTLYRDDISDGYGNCVQQGLAVTTTTDPSTPLAGGALYYLVTATNRLDEEGTKGFRSDMTERQGPSGLPACP